MVDRSTSHLPYSVKALDELPESIRRHVRLLPNRAIHDILVMPPQSYPFRRLRWFGELPFGWRTTPLRVLVFDEREVTVFSIDREDMAPAVVIPFEALIYVDLCTVLLRAHVQFAWLYSGHVETLKIEFNSVGEARMNRNLKHIRAALGTQATALPEASMADLPLKYRNYLNGSLLPDEHFVAVIYQAVIRSTRSRSRSWGWLPSFLAPNRAIALTDRCLILIEDERRAVQPDYAAFRRFVPLNHIQRITFEDGLEAVWVSIMSGADEAARFPLLPDKAAALHSALGQLVAVPILETHSPGPSVAVAL